VSVPLASSSNAIRVAVFGPLDNQGRVDAIADRLRGAIALGLIANGEQLPSEDRLANSLGVSPVSLREALVRLRADGLVETRRGNRGGSFVVSPAGLGTARLRDELATMTAYQLRDLGDLRGALAGGAARRAAERRSSDAVSRLRSLAETLDEARTAPERYRADGRFCVEVAAAAQSVRFAQLELELQITIGAMAWLTVPGDDVDSYHAHMAAGCRALVDAIDAADVARARELAERNTEHTTDRLVELHYALSDPAR
jgi:DNA-binding FadR family transcriptional regulator